MQLKEVATAIGITEAALSRIETGKTERIDFDTLKKLCDFYGVAVGDVLEYDPNGIRALDQVGAATLAT